MKRLLSILLWSAISAAFIGPGTVTTAARAGADFGLSLLWALAFSTVVCLVLQEASARITIVTGQQLGQIIRTRLHRFGPVATLAVAAVVLGCAAYEMGNIVGAVAGLGLITDFSPRLLALMTGLLAAAVLLAGSVRQVARLLAVLVAAMGVAFLACAIALRPSPADLLGGLLVPRLPVGSSLLVLGLVGTTVVPYNLFLGSGLARGRNLARCRLGLAVAIPLGGMISMAILITGTAVAGEFSFAALAEALRGQFGDRGALLLAVGLFAAGLSSAITAPLAAALTLRGASSDPDASGWQEHGRRFRSVWAAVLGCGLLFGLVGVPPVPAIILAQAFNGLLLPLVAVLLWLAINDRRLLGDDHICGPLTNLLCGLAVLLSFVLGTAGVLRAGARALGRPAPSEALLLGLAAVIAFAAGVPLLRAIKGRRGYPGTPHSS